MPPSRDSELTSLPPAVLAIGVGSNGDDPVTEVRGAEGCRWKAVPFDIEAERGQVPDNLSPDGSVVDAKEVRHVLHEHVAGSKVANGAGHLAPQNGLGMLEPIALPGRRGSLAREPAGDDVDSGSPSVNCSDVVEDVDAGEPEPEDLSTPRVDLAQPGVAQSREVQAVGEQPDPVELAADTQQRPPPAGIRRTITVAARLTRAVGSASAGTARQRSSP